MRVRSMLGLDASTPFNVVSSSANHALTDEQDMRKKGGGPLCRAGHWSCQMLSSLCCLPC